MGQVTSSIEINAAPEKVWAALSDPSRRGEWMTIHKRWKGDVPTSFTVGAQMTEVISMLGMDNVITWTVDELQEPSHLKVSGTGMAGVETSFVSALTGDAEKTVVTIQADFAGSMIVGALGKAVEKDVNQQLEQSLQNLKTFVG